MVPTDREPISGSRQRRLEWQQRHDAVIRSHILKTQAGEAMKTAFRNAAIELAAELIWVNCTDVENGWCSENRDKYQKLVAKVKELRAAGADECTIAQAVIPG